jgi:hypothetical protein
MRAAGIIDLLEGLVFIVFPLCKERILFARLRAYPNFGNAPDFFGAMESDLGYAFKPIWPILQDMRGCPCCCKGACKRLVGDLKANEALAGMGKLWRGKNG